MPVSLDAYQGIKPSVVALGTFDGVHLGHQALLNKAQSEAQRLDAASLAFVFSQPPGNYLGHPKPMLVPAREKYRLIEQLVQQVVHAEFPSLASMRPEQFVKDILCARLHVAGVVVGDDYHFGKDRAGDVALMCELGTRHGFDVHVVPAVEVGGGLVSSTRIRRAIRAGDIREGTRLLGRPPLLSGRVVRGEGRGQKLGFPTANLTTEVDVYVLPEQGIFAGVACLQGNAYPAAVYFGTKPTFDGANPVTEVHLLEEVFPPLYNATLHVHLIGKVRDDAPFDTVDALKAQIQDDIGRVRETLSGVSLNPLCHRNAASGSPKLASEV